ncbi:phosphoglucomutase (alpha-D-glucose-1,6-bisphosphate-dependent) [Candidatus Sulfurimonas baltica]|uniref:Alpha-D-glucose phosphate-specific phosphoglucomutase n=1 Tax=Candidatus Sulfurimonas baltica TaxID=2740404 RepID=A0A7S7LXI2_9BACT|nr:phosphoglucomutase (alpha-D-glucose-1,6-bisphosphate-dependent) [Candidatus Sulfurimonas baltica]QOY52414.1 alpha-D-glucose phosphate-specific phosphoglucomutase [Candidatus Sulfurimonas baltica]
MIHKNAGQKVSSSNLINIPNLISDYYTKTPNVLESSQLVAFGTSGHRGSSFKNSFNEAHIFATMQAVCDYRKSNGINGRLFIAKDTHALSTPAQISALQVCIANGVDCAIAKDDGYVPTPVLSFTVIEANKTSKELCDGIVITPSHNPPQDGGFKYNPPNGGPADTDATSVIEANANEYLKNSLNGVKKVSAEEALNKVAQIDFITPYVVALSSIIDMDLLKSSKLNVGVDPLGGSGIEVYKKINEIYGLNLEIVNEDVDPTFSFMSCDHDGKVRMDCSSPYAMASLIALKDKYDLAFANDPDFDRHGIVTKSVGLMNPNHYLSVAIWYLFQYRKSWSSSLKIGKTLVSSSMIDRVAKSINREVIEVPVGFKWFVDGLSNGSIGFGGEESAGASFLRKDGSVWTTDKDGIILNLLAFEITEKLKKDPGTIYKELESQFGVSYYERSDAQASPEQKAKLKKLSPDDIVSESLAGEKIDGIFTQAPGNNESIGGLKVTTKNGWFAARPSGTEDIYKIYAESFISKEHLSLIQEEAKTLVLSVI